MCTFFISFLELEIFGKALKKHGFYVVLIVFYIFSNIPGSRKDIKKCTQFFKFKYVLYTLKILV